MFLPMELILDPDGYFPLREFRDTSTKLHTKPALQLLFHARDMACIKSMIFYSDQAEKNPLLVFSALAGASSGPTHCTAWHLDLPLPVERILWWITSLSIVGVCLYTITTVSHDSNSIGIASEGLLTKRQIWNDQGTQQMRRTICTCKWHFLMRVLVINE